MSHFCFVACPFFRADIAIVLCNYQLLKKISTDLCILEKTFNSLRYSTLPFDGLVFGIYCSKFNTLYVTVGCGRLRSRQSTRIQVVCASAS